MTVTEPTALVLGTSQVNVSCNGGSDGSVNLTVSGGTASYTYAWDNGQTTEDISGLISGDYKITVTDAKNCTANKTVTITQPDVLNGSAIATAVTCNGGTNGGVTLTVSGGTSGFTYLWSNAATTKDISDVPAGLYSVTITDSKNCKAIVTATVTEPSEISATGAVKNVKCFGLATGEIDLTVSGGTPGYTYSWAASNGGSVPLIQENNQDLTGLIAGTYTVTITDSKSCTKALSFNITQPASALSLSTVKTDILCNGNNDGSINLSVTGGTSPFTYNWGGGITTSNRSSLAAGNYSVDVTDANSCMATTSVTINQPDILT
ncbi:MAG: hypothetical protein F9K10_04405, partial [Paludibacter sp.]